MNRKVDGLIFLGCFAIIVLFFTKFSVATAVNETNFDVKADLHQSISIEKRSFEMIGNFWSFHAFIKI